MSALRDYDYALLYLVPRVTADERVCVGAVLHCRTARFLAVRTRLDARAETLAAGTDLTLVGRFLAALEAVAAGGADAAPIGLLPPSERFHWLTAPRSTVLQPGPVRGGRTVDPAAAFEALWADAVGHFSDSVRTAPQTWMP